MPRVSPLSFIFQLNHTIFHAICQYVNQKKSTRQEFFRVSVYSLFRSHISVFPPHPSAPLTPSPEGKTYGGERGGRLTRGIYVRFRLYFQCIEFIGIGGYDGRIIGFIHDKSRFGTGRFFYVFDKRIIDFRIFPITL